MALIGSINIDRRLATSIRILKGEKAGDLPVQAPTQVRAGDPLTWHASDLRPSTTITLARTTIIIALPHGADADRLVAADGVAPGL